MESVLVDLRNVHNHTHKCVVCVLICGVWVLMCGVQVLCVVAYVWCGSNEHETSLSRSTCSYTHDVAPYKAHPTPMYLL